MAIESVIFDIDGLLIDSEPLWTEAAAEVFKEYNFSITEKQYLTSTGLRTKEFVDWWFSYFNIDAQEAPIAEQKIINTVLRKIEQSGNTLPGVHYILNLFHDKGLKIGLATSSPQELIDLVLAKTGIAPYISATASARFLPYGKPHPQVYLDCAEKLGTAPTSCLCFEDSFNGMISAKAARMKCVVVPHHAQLKEERWGAADLKLSSLQNFGELHFGLLSV
ncbi:hexitol phosphatase HxpB [Parasediminibacterium sp. JCM 36343]|uniref:hexitol phosphatase HxpB n=1 Tax=Parasediminibacterium sp. JCM 36343 TaxID=3374279 RepID=UPI00397A219E